MTCKDRGDVDKDGDSARVRILWSSSFSTALQKLINIFSTDISLRLTIHVLVIAIIAVISSTYINQYIVGSFCHCVLFLLNEYMRSFPRF